MHARYAIDRRIQGWKEVRPEERQYRSAVNEGTNSSVTNLSLAVTSSTKP